MGPIMNGQFCNPYDPSHLMKLDAVFLSIYDGVDGSDQLMGAEVYGKSTICYSARA